jgi:hypothetical protein
MAFRPLRLSTNLTDFPSNTEYGDSEFAQVGGLQLYNNLTAPSHLEGQLYYDKDNHALTVDNDESEINQQLGRQTLVRVYNNSGVTISKGKVCYVSGSEGTENRATIGLALANGSVESRVAGVAGHDIENNTFGYILSVGELRGIDTSGMTAGATIYLSAATPGNFTMTPPSSVNGVEQVGYIVSVNATTGNILVDIRGFADSRILRPTIVLSFQSQANPTININSASYTTVARFVYGGTDNIFSPILGQVISSGTGNTGSYRIVDVTNSTTICEATNVTLAATPAIYSLGAVSNLPAAQAVFALEARKDSGGGSIGVSGLTLS